MTWTITSTSLQALQLLNEESLFFTGNGYLGVRGNLEEGKRSNAKSVRGTYLNAFYDTVPISYQEKLFAFPETQQKLLNLIDAQTILLYFGEEGEEEVFSMETGEILGYTRTLHLDQGYTERAIHWRSPLGKEVKIIFRRLVSFVQKELFIQQVIVEPVTFFGRLRLLSLIDGEVSNYVDPSDPRLSPGHAKRLQLTECSYQAKEGISYIEVQAECSRLKAGCATTHSLQAKSKIIEADSSISTQYILELQQAVTLEKRSVYVDTLRHGECLKEAACSVQQSRVNNMSFAFWQEKQREYLEGFWQITDIQLHGDPSLQEAIRFNLFHLLQSTGTDGISNIAAKGLSGEGYEGHYFWDTEIYMLPVYMLTNPSIAKQLLLYRYSILPAARERAKEMGHAKGALYPWRTIAGTECSSFFPAGTAQYHISADIAYSFIQYYLVTKDFSFLEHYGAEVLFETARLWLEVGHERDGLFRIEAVTGPDEYTCLVNNNYYTNAMAKHNLIWATKVYRMLEAEANDRLKELERQLGLDRSEVSAWRRAAEIMYLPYDPSRRINPQDDSFLEKKLWDLASTPKEKFPLLLHYHPLTLYRYQVCKQADTVLAHFLLEDEESQETIRHSYDYYERITTHDSSLSSCIFSIMAAKIGYEQKAYDYFVETVRLDLDNRHGNTKDGLHLANMGGTWLALVFGFAGVRIKEAGLSLQPILPSQWEGYSFPLHFQERRLCVQITKEQLTITLIHGNDLSLTIYGQAYALQANRPLLIPRKVEQLEGGDLVDRVE